MQKFRIPNRSETPSDELMDFLHSTDVVWDGDSEGLYVQVNNDLLTLYPGQYLIVDDLDIYGEDADGNKISPEPNLALFD